ncbi:hypothetical protein KIH74_20100 [Kineosporia sp. J2-2]|uniref:Uncharacterized protein n=1 Tax=Kineosporia corallincola TaxID=2835133 RepID=A0ABS5TMG8_9ACTN|nr:hypothetical protein [Kineosporia corallincola]MBT0771253.1 hypothetical protein [Kineosporia corallincola]
MDLATLGFLVFGAVLWAIWRSGELRGFQVLAAALVGFFLASSAIAPSISTAVQTVFDWVSTWSIA